MGGGLSASTAEQLKLGNHCVDEDDDNVDTIGDVNYPYFKEDSACLMGLGSVEKYLSDP